MSGPAPQARLSTREMVAAAVSVAIILAAAVYWTVQILDVIATLKMAYG